MKKNPYLLNMLLALVLGAALLIGVILRAFVPRLILPELGIPTLTLIALIALVLEHDFLPGTKRCYPCLLLLSAVTFGLLPFAACFVGLREAGKLALIGSLLFGLLTFLYDSIRDRLSTGPAAKAAPLLSALSLYLAMQCFQGILL